ncbi:MAG: sulfatase-like hydrolase/transferase [Maribacter sp.]
MKTFISNIFGEHFALKQTKVIVLCLFVFGQWSFAQKRPNIVFILADDAGYADFGFQGSKEFKTPRLDVFAKESIRCTQAYVSAAVCGPSRAGFLTGIYQQRFGFEENNVPGYMSASGSMGDDMGLPLNQRTIADELRKQGYKTAIFGKWHMGNAERFHPTKRGFDEFFGFRGGARSFMPYDENNAVEKDENRLEQGFGNFLEHDGYLTDVLADEANKFIVKHKNESFFIYLSFNAVHTPMQATKEDLKQFPKLTGKRKTLAAMTLAMDRACGKVFDQLRNLNLLENTIIVFTNDNGGPSDSNTSLNKPLSGTKANHLEGGIRVPFLVSWKGNLQSNTTYDHPISLLDMYPTFSRIAGVDKDKLSHLDGVDLMPFFKNYENGRPHEILYWKKENRGAIRELDWKLIRYPDRPAELYDLSKDIAEEQDLAMQYPDKVRALYKKLFQWELGLERPKWQLQRKFEGKAAERMDAYSAPKIRMNKD